MPLERRRGGALRQRSDRYREVNRAAIRLSAAFSPLIRMAIVVGFTATLIYGGWMALTGSLAVGAYGVMVFLTQRLLWPLTRLGQTFDLYQRAMASTTRVLDVLDRETVVESGDRELAEVAGDVAFDDVSFGYLATHPILQHADLRMPAGQTTAIVGATGAGKSTVVKLLLRFYDVEAGTISIDGHDIRTLSLRSLRGAIGLVSQDVFLFHGTVRENIVYGSWGASQEAIERAARLALHTETVLARARYAVRVEGSPPEMVPAGDAYAVVSGRHPLLLARAEPVVPFDLRMEAAERTLVGRVALPCQ